MTTEDYEKILHEIKNNITFISSSLQLIEKLHPEIKEFSYWNNSIEEITSLKKMLIHLSSARLCRNPSLEKLSLNNFLTEFVQSCSGFFDPTDFHCELELEPSLPEISIDPDQMKRALYNLVKNSYEAMNASGTIYLSAHKEEHFVCLNLLDSGGGMDPLYLPKLFTPFETTKTSGTGLGLVITRQIIEAHGGHLTVDSRPQEGCTFSVYLPYETTQN